MNIKLFGICSLIFLTVASAAVNWWQYETIGIKNQRIGTLTSDLAISIDANNNLANQIEQMEQERIFGQQRADELARLRSKRKKQLVETVTVIQEVLVHEECADKPIPLPVNGLHYY